MEEIIGRVAMPLAILIAVVFTIVLFRVQLGELLERLKTLEIDPVKRQVKLKFHEKVMQAKRNAKGITSTVAASRSVAASHSATLPEPVQNRSVLKARDIVLGSWGSLKQIMYDACAAKNIPLTPSTSPLEAAARLYQADWIGSEVVEVIGVLYELAQELTEDTTIRPYPKDAIVYASLANVVLSWMMINVLPAKDVAEEIEDVHRQRLTVVSGDFGPPTPGKPTALLIGIGGPVRGRKYAIERTQVQIGADNGSDLLISSDQYVSAIHAMLRYEHNNLFLLDQNSLNGTFLNERPVTGSAVLVRAGDRIRFGESEFQVSVTESSPVNKEIAGASAHPSVH